MLEQIPPGRKAHFNTSLDLMMIGMNRLPRVCRRKNHEIMKIGDERFSARNICATLYDDSVAG